MARVTMIGMGKDFQARHDAHVLREAEEIKANATRHRAAKTHVQKEIKNMEKVVNGGASKRPAPKRSK